MKDLSHHHHGGTLHISPEITTKKRERFTFKHFRQENQNINLLRSRGKPLSYRRQQFVGGLRDTVGGNIIQRAIYQTQRLQLLQVFPGRHTSLSHTSSGQNFRVSEQSLYSQDVIIRLGISSMNLYTLVKQNHWQISFMTIMNSIVL